MTHPVYVDGVAPQKGNARVYTPIVLGNADALRALSLPNAQLVFIKALGSWFAKDTSDTTSADNGATVIWDFDSGVWKIVDGAGVGIDAAGLLAGRAAFDAQDPGFTYFGTDTELLYVRLNAGGWSTGTELTGPQGPAGSALLTATSASSIALEAGSKVFTLAEEAERGFGAGSWVIEADASNPTTKYRLAQVVSYVHPTLTTTAIADDLVGSGTIANWVISAASLRGLAGRQPGLLYAFDTVTTEGADAGTVRANNVDLSAGGELYIADQDATGEDHAAYWIEAANSTSVVKGFILIKRVLDGKVTTLRVDAAPSDETGYTKFTYTHESGPTSIAAAASISIKLDPKGDAGDGASDFTGLDDTPANFSGAALNRVRVNSGATALEFVEPGAEISGATAKATPHNNDVFGISDSEASGVFKKLSWTNIKTALASVFASLSGAVFTGAIQTTTIEVGHASDTTLSRSAAGVVAVEGVPLNPGIPITDKSTAYTGVLADRNTALRHPAADNNARTFTIPANGSVAYPVGTFLTFINEINTVTIAITTDTLVLAGAGTTGSRSLAANGIATALKVASTRWYISGTGLT